MQGSHFAMIGQVRAYWEALRNGQALPHRAAIDPRGIEGALASAFLIERIAPGIARFRVAGNALNDLMGMDVRGMPISAMFDPSGRSRLASVLDAVFTGPSALDMALEADRGIGRPAMVGRMLILPLRDETGTDLALGCLATEGLIGRSPRRFYIARALQEPITVGPAIAPALARRPDRTPEKPGASGFAEPKSAFTPKAPAPKAPVSRHERPYLRLVRPDE